MTTEPQLPNECSNILYTSQQIADRIDELAREISSYYANILEKDEFLVLVPVLSGSYMFVADLSRKLSIPNKIDFIALSSYADSTSTTGEVKILMDTRQSMHGKHVLIVEDIIDTGYTLQFLENLFQTRSPKSMKAAVLLTAPKQKRKVNFHVDFYCFDIGPRFVVGYGLDYAGKYRSLPYIAELKQEVIDSSK
jgi:hypoxanthine phosphoribosyltransferase